MKKLFIVLAAAAMAVSVNAAKGDMVLSGTIGFGVDGATKVDGKKNGTSSTDFTILPSFTYFISDKVGVGAAVGYDGSSTKRWFDDKEVDNSKVSNGAFVINPFVRYYLIQTAKFGVFGQADLRFAFGSNKAYDLATDKDKTTSTTDIRLSVTPGIQYFINSKWSIETTFSNNLLGFNYSKNNDTKSSTTDFNFLNVNKFYLPFNALAISLNYHF
jgi:hypothetical protein